MLFVTDVIEIALIVLLEIKVGGDGISFNA